MSQTNERVSIKRGFSKAADEAEAVRELAAMIAQPGAAVVCFFASSRYDLARLGALMQKSFDALVIGCTTAGEITPDGYAQGSLSGFSIASQELQAHPFLINSLHEFDSEKTRLLAKSLRDCLTEAQKHTPEARAFGILLIDGLSVMEEQVVAILANVMEDVPIVGGSAGDDFKLEKTHIYFDGKFISDAALFTLFITTLPFTTVKTQHFLASVNRLVITKADPEKRIVYEINGLPAAEEYARVVGIEVAELQPMTFSTFPVMLRIGGEYYVRSIQKVNADGSLTFFCAIDEGLVLRVAQGEQLVKNLADTFSQIRRKIPDIKLTIGFDCILRLLEVKEKCLESEVDAILKQNNVIGFNTYGEQFNAVHVNQTFTGVVLGE